MMIKTINDLVNWLYLLADESTFRQEIATMVTFYDSDIIETIDRSKGVLKVHEHNQRTNKHSTEVVSFGEHILATSMRIINYPAKKVIPYLSDSNKALYKLDLAEKLTESNSFYSSTFPQYFKAIELTKGVIIDSSLRMGLKKGKRGNPKLPGLPTANKALIISKAVSLLKKDPSLYCAKQGAFVSEILKTTVFDHLKKDIPDLSIHKVSRVLLKYFRTK